MVRSEHVLHGSQPSEPSPGPKPGSLFLSLPVLQRLEVLRQLKACLGEGGSNQVPSLDDLAASFLEQRQPAPQPPSQPALQPASQPALQPAIQPAPQAVTHLDTQPATHLDTQPFFQADERIRIMEAPEAFPSSPEHEPGRSPPVRPDEVPVLVRHGVFHDVVRRILMESLIRTVSLDQQHHQAMVLAKAGLGAQPDAPMDAEALQDYMDDLRLRFWIETTYSDSLERWFLKHRHELESWIFSCLRVPEEGLAAELFLQLTDDGADAALLTDRHGIGKERWTRGVVGPVRVNHVAEPLRQVLAGMAVGAIHPPLEIGDDWVILQLLHRFPAEPDGEWRHDVRWSMFEADLDANAERVCHRISSGEGIPLEATLAELSWRHEDEEGEGEPQLPPAEP